MLTPISKDNLKLGSIEKSLEGGGTQTFVYTSQFEIPINNPAGKDGLDKQSSLRWYRLDAEQPRGVYRQAKGVNELQKCNYEQQ